MTSRVAVVAARPGPLATAVSSALEGAGAVVSVVPPPFADPATAAEAVAGGPDVVVWADVDPDGLRPDPLVGLGELDWDRRCEEPLRSALFLLQAAYPHLRGRDGRVVLVCPSVALEGAAGLVPLATAAEGQRLLAKSAARRWGQDGVTVNIVTVPVAALGADVTAAADAARTAAALPTADALEAAAGAVVWLVGEGAAGITGTTIVGADGEAMTAP